ncbi:MAG: hypothetical protein ACI4QX_09635 [Lachnospiraceae bacterium]
MKQKLVLAVLGMAVCLAACGTKEKQTSLEPTASVREEITQPPEALTELTKAPADTSITEPTKKPAAAGSPQLLLGQLKLMKEKYSDLSEYQNGSELQAVFDKADALVAKGETDVVTQQEYNDMLQELRTTVAGLLNRDGLPEPSKFTEAIEMPDPYTFLDGRKVTTPEEFDERLEEIKHMYEYYMYGPVPDASGEEVTYSIQGNVMTVTVTHDGRSASYQVNISLPTNKVYEEAPVLFVFGGIWQNAYANERGYAVLSVNPTDLAADHQTRIGAFYDLYPYGAKWTEQTGALAAWGWGISKAIDALENGAAAELGLTTTDFLLTGVSRYGKATAVTGAFEERIKITAPSCSGAGGMALYRYTSEGTVYDYTEIGRGSAYKFGTNEPLSSLRGSSEAHWFNDNFLTFKDETVFPLEQYMLAALCGRGGRYLVISGSYCDEDWVNAPSMWMNYLASKDLFDTMGISDHLAICLHETGHMVTDQDLVYLLDYADYHLYGKEPASDLSDLTTSLYALPKNADAEFEQKLIFR